MQLDFFNHSHSVSLRNDVILALQRCDAPAAQLALATLGQHSPGDDCLLALQQLIVVLAERTQAAFQTHAALRTERLVLQNTTTPAALQSFGPAEAAPWLRQRWQELATRAAALPFRAEHLEDHAAPLWLQARQWQAGADAVTQIESWRRIPAPLSWMLQARLKLHGLQANWGLLAELAWLAPRRLETVIQLTAEPILQTLVRKFEENYEGAGTADDLAWLPAWVLTERPALAPALTQAQASQYTPPEQAMRVMLELLGLERQGRQRDLIEQRKTLRELNAALYRTYMSTR